jgi:hypothetical protein
MENKEIKELIDSSWQEKVYIETTEHIISGYVFMPKIGKRNRLLSEILNSGKLFLAVKDVSLESKLIPQRNVEHHDFLEVNVSSILIMRPFDEN